MRTRRAWLAALGWMALPLALRARAAGDGGELHAAVARGDLAAVRRLARSGAPLDERDGQGRTPLLLATQRNQIEIARALITAGADVNAQDDLHDSAYLLAGARGHDDILRATLAHGADLRSVNRYGGTALIPACERGHVSTVRILLAAGVDPDHVNRLGWTCLLEAVILGDGGAQHQDIVRQLIAAGANLNRPDGQGVSALAHARRKDQRAVVQMLQQAGAR